MRDFKYRTRFSSAVLACSRLESEEWAPWNISQASLDSLKDLMPEGVDLNKNIDLLGVAFNAAVVNRFNRNGDGIDTTTALQIKDYFINKPANIEHQRQKVVGHIVGSSFSGFKTNNLLSGEEVEHLEGPFNIALAAVVYKTVNPAFASALEEMGEEGFDKEISASWEIGFNDFAIALGSKNVNDAEIIQDPSRVKDFEKYLRAEGGAGVTDDGVEVYRLVRGEVYPLGIGFTTNPAADVEGVHVIESPLQEIRPLMERKEKPEDISPKSTQNISHLNKSTVNTENYKLTMEQEHLIQKLEEILDDKLEKKEYAKETVASIAGVISDAIRVKSDQYVQEKKELDEEKDRLAKAEEEFKSSTQELQEKLRVTEEKVEALEGEKSEREAKARFNSRMALIDEEYELDNEDRQIIASELSTLSEDDEAFDQLKGKFSVVWKTKSKAYIEEYNQKLEAQIEEEVGKRLESLAEAQASTSSESSEQSESAEDVLENAEVEEAAVVTNNSAEASRQDETLAEKFRSVFNKENVNIKY